MTAAEKTGFRQSMAWLHTWAGLLPGWLLFAIFLFGTTAFFQHEISRWMRPELRSYAVSPAALDTAGRYLADNAPEAANWTISLPPLRGGDALSVLWRPREGSSGKEGKAALDPATGRAFPLRETSGGWFLYRFHFDLHYMPVMWARYLVCIAALAMLVALLSGIVTHKKIFADFFLLRFGKGQRSWLDAHNVTGILALPFHLMITYTGLVALLFTVMPWAISANFPSQKAFYAAAYPEGPQQEASGRKAPVVPISRLVEQARRQWNGAAPGYIQISNPGDANAVVTIWPASGALGTAAPPLHFGAGNGVLLAAGPSEGAARRTQKVMVQLHTGAFASITLRWLYFIAGTAGTVMIATGLILWTVKRRARLPDPSHPPLGFRGAEKLNVAVIAGSLSGIAVYFLSNRLLPLGLHGREEWEINSLFIAWGAALAWTVARPANRAWIETLAAGAVLFGLVPVVSALTTSRGLPASLAAWDLFYVAFDLVMLIVAAGLAFAARSVARKRQQAGQQRRRAQAVLTEAAA